jgi:integrase
MGRITGPDIVAHKLALIREGAGPKTVENHLTMLRTIFRWAKAHHKISGDDPTAGIPVKAKGNREGRRNFSPEDRGAILYHAQRADRPVIKWANLIGLFGGPRLEEIVEADTRDVRIIDGIPVLDIRDDHRGANCRIKNPQSVRQFPLHPLYAESFLAYVASLPPGPLFPDVPTDQDGKRSDRASNILNPWLDDTVGITDPRKVYHSHRHSALSLMVNNGVDSVIAKRVTGHTGKDVAEKVYYHGEVPELYAAVEAIPVPRPLVPPKDIIDAIPDPTADPEPAGYAEAAE